MNVLFTPASQRVVDFAAGWVKDADCSELTVHALLLGLLSEPECRASSMLARWGIDADAVRKRWPTLTKINPPSESEARPRRFSDDVRVSLQLVKHRLADFPKPLELATEHILLGLISADHEVAAWLRQHGIDPDQLDSEIHLLYGLAAPSAHGIETIEAVGEEFFDVNKSAPVETASLDCPADMTSTAVALNTDPPLAEEVEYCSAGVAAIEPVRWVPMPFTGQSDIGVLRILDAAANRAREAIRVVEDYVRFVLDDAHLTGVCKQLRHDLTAALAHVPNDQRMAARETQADVGTPLTTSGERHREDTANVLAANFARLQESLRSLEEFGKVLGIGRDRWGNGRLATESMTASPLTDNVNDDLAAACKQLRYRTYTLQRAVEITRTSSERLADARLYVLIDGQSSFDAFRRLVGLLINAGVDVIQLRDKRLGDRELLDRARLLRKATAGTHTLMVINDRPDLAALAEADGVHVGQDELSVKDARTIVGPDALIGVSTHSIEQARQAVLDGANYIGCGPTFPSGTKSFERFPGVELLRVVAAEIRLPAFAIGGIERDNVDQVLAAGFSRIAVGGAIASAHDPAAAARELLAAMPNRRGQ